MVIFFVGGGRERERAREEEREREGGGPVLFRNGTGISWNGRN